MPPPPARGPPPGGGGGQVAQLEAQMAAATASGNFEMCIALREQVRPSYPPVLLLHHLLASCFTTPLLLHHLLSSSTTTSPLLSSLLSPRQIKQAKRGELEAQINAAAASNQFERCIQLREELNRLG